MLFYWLSQKNYSVNVHFLPLCHSKYLPIDGISEKKIDTLMTLFISKMTIENIYTFKTMSIKGESAVCSVSEGSSVRSC